MNKRTFKFGKRYRGMRPSNIYDAETFADKLCQDWFGQNVVEMEIDEDHIRVQAPHDIDMHRLQKAFSLWGWCLMSEVLVFAPHGDFYDSRGSVVAGIGKFLGEDLLSIREEAHQDQIDVDIKPEIRDKVIAWFKSRNWGLVEASVM